MQIKKIREHEKNLLFNLREKIKDAQKNKNYPTHFKLPIGIQYELTSKCNMECIHCYNNSAKNKADQMEINDWINLTEALVDNGGVFQCIISGGEPLLLGDNLYKIMDLLHLDNTIFTIITNGYLLDKSTINKLSQYRYNRFQVSIDSSNEEEHDRFRQKNGSWRKAVKAAYMVSERNLPLVIATSVTPQNINSMNEMANLSFKLGASVLIFGKVMMSGRAVLHKNIILSQREEELFIKEVEEIRNNYLGLMQVQISANLKYQLDTLKSTPMDAVIIRPNGDVRLDCSLPFVIGNVLEEGFLEIWRKKCKTTLSHPKINQFIEEIDENTGDSSFLINYFDEDIYI